MIMADIIPVRVKRYRWVPPADGAYKPYEAHQVCLGVAAALVGITLFVVGAVKTMSTKGHIFFDGMENFCLGAFAGGVSYAVGYAFQAIVLRGSMSQLQIFFYGTHAKYYAWVKTLLVR